MVCAIPHLPLDASDFPGTTVLRERRWIPLLKLTSQSCLPLLESSHQFPSVDPEERKARTLMCFNATLAALKGVGAISDEEMTEWTNRMLVALGGAASRTPFRPGTARLINFGGKGRGLAPFRPPDPGARTVHPRLGLRYISLIGRWNTAVGSRSSGWSCTATRSPSTGGSLRYPTQKPCSPVELAATRARCGRSLGRFQEDPSGQTHPTTSDAKTLSHNSRRCGYGLPDGPVVAQVVAAMKGGDIRIFCRAYQQTANRLTIRVGR